MAIITISRGSFAGGKAVAERLSQQLGCPLLSREEVVHQAAQDYGLQESELIKLLSESPHFWQQALGKRLAYVKCVTASLFEHARDGNLIHHGHVGHILLSGIPYVLRIRVIANMDFRIQMAANVEHLTREQAIAHIQNTDAQRRRWVQTLYGVDWEDPAQYTAVLNISQLGVEGTCATIARMAELPEFQPTAETRRLFENQRLASRVWVALAKNASTRSAGLDVTAKDGEVLIQGSVGSVKAMELIPQLAGAVEGVKSVRCEAGMGADWYW